MNRDGRRGDARTAGHEAAHAVVAVLSGLSVAEVTIATPQTQRGLAGSVDLRDRPMPTPRSATALVDTYAAGCAWELTVARTAGGWLLARFGSDADRAGFTAADFDTAVQRVTGFLLDPAVLAAVTEVADRLLAGKSGSIFGTTVERILLRRGLVPALDESWRAENQTTAAVAAAVSPRYGEAS